MTPRIAFVIVAHKQPDQLRRLIERLSPHPVFVHVDGRAPDSVFGPILQMERSGYLTLLPRLRTGWASWNLVDAMLSGVRHALKKEWSHVVLLSGQDYLLRPADYIAQYLADRPAASWIHAAAIPVPFPRIGDADGGMARISKWCLTLRGRHLRWPVRRSLPSGVVGHYGQMQCCLSRPLAQLLISQFDQRPELRNFFRHTQAPDELMIPSLALSSPLADSVRDENIWYADWLSGGPHPKTLTMDDFERLAFAFEHGGDMAGPSPVKFFARKFDEQASEALLDRIDQEFLS